MFGVINFVKPSYSKYHYLELYSDISLAVSFFFEINKQHSDVKIIPNINNSFELLSSQHILYQIENLDSFHIPISTILNIAIIRDEDLKCTLGSMLLSLSLDQIDLISEPYKIHKIITSEQRCSLCQIHFKIFDINNNDGYQGCVYNPCYYNVVTLENLEDYHAFGNKPKINDEISKLNFDRSKIFFVVMSGRLHGLHLSKIPLTENLFNGDFICWHCIDKMDDDFIPIWSH